MPARVLSDIELWRTGAVENHNKEVVPGLFRDLLATGLSFFFLVSGGGF